MTDKCQSGAAVDDLKNERAMMEQAVFVFDSDVQAGEAGGNARRVCAFVEP